MPTPFKNIDEYILLQPEPMRLALESLRQIVWETAPEAEETISYKMPAFKYHGMLVYFAAFKNHYSLFPSSYGVFEHFKEDLKGFYTSKGTIRFTLDQPIPEDLLRRIIQFRMAENLAKGK